MTNPVVAAVKDIMDGGAAPQAKEVIAAAAQQMAREVDARLGGGPSVADDAKEVTEVKRIKKQSAKHAAQERARAKVNPDTTAVSLTGDGKVVVEEKAAATTSPQDAAPTDAPSASQSEDTSMAKTKKNTKTKRAAKVKAPKADKGPGVVATIARMMQRGNGASKAEIHAELIKVFPGRKKDALLTTASLQVNRYPKEHKLKVLKEKSDKRGLVYYLAKPKA
jgi:hypothetical protein